MRYTGVMCNARQCCTSAFIAVLALTSPALTAPSAAQECILGLDNGAFEPSDHTRVIQAAMDNLLPLLGQIGIREHILEGTAPESENILRALLELRSVPDDVKDVARRVLLCVPVLDAGSNPEIQRLRNSAAVVEALRRLRSATDLDLNELVDALQAIADGRNIDDKTKAALISTIEIASDGSESIYSTEHDYYQALTAAEDTPNEAEASARNHVRDILADDLSHALVGALTGCIIAITSGCAAGAASGAAIGALGGSLQPVVRKGLSLLRGEL